MMETQSMGMPMQSMNLMNAATGYGDMQQNVAANYNAMGDTNSGNFQNGLSGNFSGGSSMPQAMNFQTVVDPQQMGNMGGISSMNFQSVVDPQQMGNMGGMNYQSVVDPQQMGNMGGMTGMNFQSSVDPQQMGNMGAMNYQSVVDPQVNNMSGMAGMNFQSSVDPQQMGSMGGISSMNFQSVVDPQQMGSMGAMNYQSVVDPQQMGNMEAMNYQSVVDPQVNSMSGMAGMSYQSLLDPQQIGNMGGVMNVQTGSGNFNAYEMAYYKNLLNSVDVNNTGVVSGAAGKEFLKKSGLPDSLLREVWSIADPNGSGTLNTYGFYCACRLVAHVQAGLLLSPDATSIEPASLPHFDLTSTGKNDSYGYENYTSRGDGGTIGVNHYDTTAAVAGMDESLGNAVEASSKQLDWNEMMNELPSIAVEEFDWSMPTSYQLKYRHLFRMHDLTLTGYINGIEAKDFLSKSGLSQNELMLIWDLADQDKDGQLNLSEFAIAVHLINCRKTGMPIPDVLPKALALIIKDGLVVTSTDDPQSEDMKQLKSAMKQPSMSQSTAIVKSEMRTAASNQQYAKLDKIGEDYRRSIKNLQEAVANSPIDIYKEIIEGDSRVNKALEVDVDGLATKLSKMMEGSDSLKNDIVAERIQIAKNLDRKKEAMALLEEERNKFEALQEERRHCEFDRIAEARTLEYIQAEVVYMRKLVEESASDVKMILSNNMSLERECSKAERYVSTLDTTRKGVATALRTEKDLLEEEERELAELKNTMERMRRDKAEASSKGAALQEKMRQADQDRVLLMTAIENERAKLIVTKDARLKAAAERYELVQEIAAMKQQSYMQSSQRKPESIYGVAQEEGGRVQQRSEQQQPPRKPRTNVGYGVQKDAKGVPFRDNAYNPPAFYTMNNTKGSTVGSVVDNEWTSFGNEKDKQFGASVAAGSTAKSRITSFRNASNTPVVEANDSISNFEKGSQNGDGGSVFWKGKGSGGNDGFEISFSEFGDFQNVGEDDAWKGLSMQGGGESTAFGFK